MQEAPCRAMTRGLLFYYSFYYFCRPNCAKIGETIPSEKRRKVIKVYRIVEKAELFQDIQDYAKATKSAAINSKKIGYVWIVVDDPGAAGAELLDTPEAMLDNLFM